MFEKILVVSEFIPNFDYFLKAIRSLHKLGTEKCLICQFFNKAELNETISTFMLDIFRENFEQQKNLLAAQGFDVEAKASLGLFSIEDINQIASQEDCSLIVTGASEHTWLGGFLAGGAAHCILHDSAMPQLIVRVPALPVDSEIEFAAVELSQHVLFPTDFSENANQAFEYLKQMASMGITKITLMHIQEKSRIDPHLMDRLEEFNNIDTAKLQVMAEQLKEIGATDVGIILPFGSPTAEILKTVQEQQVSLVIMGTQGRGWIKEIYLGSVSHNVARHSSASILLIPQAST